MRSKDFRRHQKDRMKAKARSIGATHSLSSQDHVNHLVKNADNLAKCSCPMCGNPRRHFGRKTLKEISFKDRLSSD